MTFFNTFVTCFLFNDEYQAFFFSIKNKILYRIILSYYKIILEEEKEEDTKGSRILINGSSPLGPTLERQ